MTKFYTNTPQDNDNYKYLTQLEINKIIPKPPKDRILLFIKNKKTIEKAVTVYKKQFPSDPVSIQIYCNVCGINLFSLTILHPNKKLKIENHALANKEPNKLTKFHHLNSKKKYDSNFTSTIQKPLQIIMQLISDYPHQQRYFLDCIPYIISDLNYINLSEENISKLSIVPKYNPDCTSRKDNYYSEYLYKKEAQQIKSGIIKSHEATNDHLNSLRKKAESSFINTSKDMIDKGKNIAELQQNITQYNRNIQEMSAISSNDILKDYKEIENTKSDIDKVFTEYYKYTPIKIHKFFKSKTASEFKKDKENIQFIEEQLRELHQDIQDAVVTKDKICNSRRMIAYNTNSPDVIHIISQYKHEESNAISDLLQAIDSLKNAEISDIERKKLLKKSSASLEKLKITTLKILQIDNKSLNPIDKSYDFINMVSKEVEDLYGQITQLNSNLDQLTLTCNNFIQSQKSRLSEYYKKIKDIAQTLGTVFASILSFLLNIQTALRSLDNDSKN